MSDSLREKRHTHPGQRRRVMPVLSAVSAFALVSWISGANAAFFQLSDIFGDNATDVGAVVDSAAQTCWISPRRPTARASTSPRRTWTPIPCWT